MENVISIDFKRRGDNMSAKGKPKNNLECGHCGHTVSDITDWEMGLSPINSRDSTENASGVYFCEKCDHETGHTAFDLFVRYEATGPFAGLNSSVPTEVISEVIESIGDDLPAGYYFNVGHAIMNAARLELLRTFNDDASVLALFGPKSEYVENEIQKIRSQA